MTSSFEALVPDRPDAPSFSRRQEYHSLSATVSRAARPRVLSSSVNNDTIDTLGNGPPARSSAGARYRTTCYEL